MLSWSFVRVRICIPGDIFLVHVDVLYGRFLGRKAVPIIARKKKRKGLMVCIPSVIKTNWRSIYLWAISKFGLSIYIFFDGVAIWFGNESGRYICALWFMASQQWKHRGKKFFWMHKLFMCVFGESTNAKMRVCAECQTARKWLRAFYFVWLALVWGMTTAFRTSCFRNNSHRFTSNLEVWVWWQCLT